MKRLSIALLAGTALIGGAAFAQDDPEQSTAAQATAQAGPQQTDEEFNEEDERSEEVVCKTDKVTGSLIRRRRTCMTRAEWREQDRRLQSGLHDFNNGASGAPACINAVDAACGGPLPGMPGQ